MFALYLDRSSARLIHAQHGLIRAELPLARPRASLRKPQRIDQPKDWEFGQLAASDADALHAFQDVNFPWPAYLSWLLSPLQPWRKARLALILPQSSASERGLWSALLAQLGLTDCRFFDALEILLPTRQGILLYLHDGLARLVFRKLDSQPDTQRLGYGYYIARELRRQILTRHGLQIDFATADASWRKLACPGQQVTIQGLNARGKRQQQLMIAEDLNQILPQALQPLLEELQLLQAQQPDAPCLLLQEQGSEVNLGYYLGSQVPDLESLQLSPEQVLQGIQYLLRKTFVAA